MIRKSFLGSYQELTAEELGIAGVGETSGEALEVMVVVQSRLVSNLSISTFIANSIFIFISNFISTFICNISVAVDTVHGFYL